MTKEQFLNKYNPDKSLELSLLKSINASVQHNKLYIKNINNTLKEDIKSVWKQKLKKLSNDFEINPWDEKNHNHIIESLKVEMNKEFGELIKFKISHSQKSISVYFKHLWCMGIISTPPQCPVDRIILTQTNCLINHRKWTDVDRIDDHIFKINLIKGKMKLDGFQSLSEWELINFN